MEPGEVFYTAETDKIRDQIESVLKGYTDSKSRPEYKSSIALYGMYEESTRS